MTEEDGFNATYWATIAQVVPVFALALVFEARSYARRWSRKSDRTPNWWRAISAGALSLGGAGLIQVELMAISNLSKEMSRPTDLALVTIAMTFAVCAVVVLPLSNLAGIVVSIWIAPISKTTLMLKWSARQKRLKGFQLELLPAAATVQGARLDSLLYRIEANRSLARVRGLLSTPLDGAKQEIARNYEKDLVSYIHENELKLVKHESALAEIQATRADIAARLDEDRHGYRALVDRTFEKTILADVRRSLKNVAG